jgi:hypothetical protein
MVTDFSFLVMSICLNMYISKNQISIIELETLKVTDNYQMTSKEIRDVVRIVEKHKQDFLEAWDEYFNQ